MKRVLFSTLGMTDPIKNDFDGPLLHILRYYQPEKVYLFMTKRAHNIGAVTEEQFVKETGISSGKLLQHMFWMFKYTFPQLFKEEGDEWNSYDKMNIEIIRRLKR